jgi:hypothetical protein
MMDEDALANHDGECSAPEVFATNEVKIWYGTVV